MANLCKLTGLRGKFVKAHIIPKAFTRPESRGRPFMQVGSGKGVKKRWDSWYDDHLVIEQGEKIFAEYDDWAISFLRSKKLVWSGWGPMTSLGSALHLRVPGTPVGRRIIKVEQPAMLRLFLLSLLWRAAASEMPEFSEVRLPPDQSERLRQMILDKDPGPISFYPAQLIQLSTMGIIHNHAPIASVKRVPVVDGEPARDIPIFRFYFDGLIIHIHSHADDDGYAASLGPLMVGASDELLMSTVTYEDSFQHQNLMMVMSETIYDRPESHKRRKPN